MKTKQGGEKPKAGKTKAVKAASEVMKEATAVKKPHAPRPRRSCPEGSAPLAKGPSPKVDVPRVYTLRFKNKLSLTDIAKDQQVSVSAIAKHLKKFEKLLESPQFDDSQLSQMFKAGAVAHLCSAVDPAKVKKAGADRNALAACMLLDKARLIAGESTQNIAQIWASAAVDVDKQRRTATETATESKVIDVTPHNDKGNDPSAN